MAVGLAKRSPASATADASFAPVAIVRLGAGLNVKALVTECLTFRA
jgi:hypothetical protein